jgi:multiple antibiotic resistance protein
VQGYLSYCLVALSAIFVVVDPLSAVPMFIAMTAGDAPAKRREMALRACVAGAGLLSAFALFGAVIFRFLGVTLGAFKFAGGILLLLTALDMLRAQVSRTRSSAEEQKEGEEKEDIAIVPLAIPLLAGPGSVATVMVLMSRGPGFWVGIPVVGAIVITFIASYFMLRAAAAVDRVLGKSGNAILQRVMGLMLAAIAIQFMVDGIADLVPEMASHLK